MQQIVSTHLGTASPRHRVIRTVAVGLLLLAVLVGCGFKRSRFGAVSGKVTYKGRPVNDAALLLYPTNDTQTNPITIPVDEDGTFRIADVPPGEYKIVVQGTEGAGASDAPLVQNLPPEKVAEVKAMLEQQKFPTTIPFPKKYKDLKTTDLKCTITDSDQTQDIELKD